MEDILEYGNVQSGILGISTVPAKSPLAIKKGLDEIQGVFVEDVQEDSGAEDAGLKKGDIIVQVDNQRINKFADLTGYVSTKRPGDQLQVKVERDGDNLVFPVTLKERQIREVPNMGLTVKNLNEEEKKTYKTKKGVKIIGVPETYRGYGLNGKVILSIDDEEISDINDAYDKFNMISRYGKTVIVLVNEDGERERIIFQ